MRINFVYWCNSSGVAMMYPPVSLRESAALYEEHSSNPNSQIGEPDRKYGSPFRNYRGSFRQRFFAFFFRFRQKLLGGKGIERKLKKCVWRWDDATPAKLLQSVEGLIPSSGKISFLAFRCFDGQLLSALAKKVDWKLAGLEPNPRAVIQAREKGHRVWESDGADAIFEIPDGESFDIIFLDQTIETMDDPLAAFRRFCMLLKPTGILVLRTPNLDSRQIDLFGPNWTHWHPPYHRNLYSRKALKLLGESAGLKLRRLSTYSHPYWTAKSQALNKLGLGGRVPPAIALSQSQQLQAEDLTSYSSWFWDWRGRGDYSLRRFIQR